MIADTKHEFATEMEPFEDLDVEWGKLSREMRATEVRCAIRSFDVMSAAYNSNIPLPVDEEISDQLNESVRRLVLHYTLILPLIFVSILTARSSIQKSVQYVCAVVDEWRPNMRLQ